METTILNRKNIAFNSLSSNIKRYAALSIVLAALPSTAFAYLDPGTGSMLLQGLIALIGGIITAASMYWRSIVNFISSFKHGKNAQSSSKSDEL